MTEVRYATAAELPEVGRVLARAFAVDPVMSWLFPRERIRRKRLTTLFTALATNVYKGPEAAELARQGDRAVGASLWGPPGGQHRVTVVESLVESVFVRALGGRAGRMRALSRGLERLRPAEPHWYLSMLGTDPDFRGTGAGRLLLDSRLRRCDADGSAAYLESSNKLNLPYYEKSGFRLTGELPLPDGPTLYPMWRPAGG